MTYNYWRDCRLGRRSAPVRAPMERRKLDRRCMDHYRFRGDDDTAMVYWPIPFFR